MSLSSKKKRDRSRRELREMMALEDGPAFRALAGLYDEAPMKFLYAGTTTGRYSS